MDVISTHRLTRFYGKRIGIREVDLHVPEGCLFGFLGPNGAGKTTTIRILMGFLRASSGEARIFGRDCHRESRRIKEDVGYIPGDLRLYPWLTGHLLLDLAGKIRRRSLEAPGRELAEELELDLDLKASSMSRGTRQKLGLLLALVHRPRLVILDEPTSGLDPLMQKVLARRLRMLADAGHTVLFSSHSLAEVEQLCHRVAIVRDGGLVADESLESLRKRARRRVDLVFDSGAAASIDPPSLLDVVERNGTRWTCNLTGEIHELLSWAAAQPLADIAIRPPDLETLFYRYYGEERSGP